MGIENRVLAPGTKLVGIYKKATHVCEVVQTAEGETRFRLEDGRLFASPSAAAKAVMNGIAANGWRFWSLAAEGGGDGEPPAKGTEPGLLPSRRSRQIKKLPNQKGVDEGQVRWFCSRCMKSFLTETTAEPEKCPQGHPILASNDIA